MKITYGKVNLRFKYLYFIIILLILLLDSVFFFLITGKLEHNEPPPFDYDKFFIPFAFLIAILSINKLSSFLQAYTVLLITCTFLLALESYYTYGTFFVYPHVFSKVFASFLIPFAYSFLVKEEKNYVNQIAFLIFIAFFAHLFLFRLDILSVSAFTNTERGFSAYNAYLIVIPCLYFFNKYLRDRKFYLLLLFFIMLFFILFLQHRTVWLSTIVALTINILLIRKSDFSLSLEALFPFLWFPAVVGILGFSFVISSNPEIIETLMQRISDIENADEQGTGAWRFEQFRSYLPFILDNPIIGMRLEGFELPIQFYEHTGQQPWADGTGHHFHSFYVDRLFYFGIIGLFIVMLPIFYTLFRAFRKNSLTVEEIVMVCFVGSGLIFGFSYNYPTWYFPVIGIAVSILDRKESTEKITEQTLKYSEFTGNLNKALKI